MDFREALSWMKGLEITSVDVEIDSLIVIQDMRDVKRRFVLFQFNHYELLNYYQKLGIL